MANITICLRIYVCVCPLSISNIMSLRQWLMVAKSSPTSRFLCFLCPRNRSLGNSTETLPLVSSISQGDLLVQVQRKWKRFVFARCSSRRLYNRITRDWIITHELLLWMEEKCSISCISLFLPPYTRQTSAIAATLHHRLGSSL